MIQAVLFVIVMIALLGWPSSIYLFQRVRRVPLGTVAAAADGRLLRLRRRAQRDHLADVDAIGHPRARTHARLGESSKYRVQSAQVELPLSPRRLQARGCKAAAAGAAVGSDGVRPVRQDQGQAGLARAGSRPGKGFAAHGAPATGEGSDRRRRTVAACLQTLLRTRCRRDGFGQGTIWETDLIAAPSAAPRRTT